MQRYMIAVFNRREDAEAAVADLQEAGVGAEEIAVAAGKQHHRTLIGRLSRSDTPLVTDSNLQGQEDQRPTETGLKVGAELGAVVGLLAGIPLFLGTGVGAGLLLAGSLATALGGGITGAAAGGLTGALIGMGVAHPQAEALHEQVARGATIVSLRTDEANMDRIERIFSRHNVDEVIYTGVGGAVA